MCNYSKARAAVNSTIKAGIDIIIQQVINQSAEAVLVNQTSFENCKGIKIGVLSQKIVYKVNWKSVANQLQDTQMAADIKSAITQQAETISKGFPSMNSAQSESVVNALIDAGETLRSLAYAKFSTETFSENILSCSGSDNISIGYFTQSILADEMIQTIVQQGSMNEALIKIQQQIENYAKASAIGVDPLGALALMAIAAVAAMVLFTFGGALTGLKVAKSVLTSPYFWMMTTGISGGLCLGALAGELFGFWPKAKVDSLDTPASAEKKEKLNKAVTIGASLGAAATVGAFGLIAYFTFFRRRTAAI